jgi:hypothetical protein
MTSMINGTGAARGVRSLAEPVEDPVRPRLEC